jgi:hypothetical protein
VPRVDAFAVPGLELWFNSDDHRPPHFHAEKPGAWEVRIFFMRDRSKMFEVVWPKFGSGKPSKSDLRALGTASEKHRLALFTEWDTKVNVTAPGPEE